MQLSFRLDKRPGESHRALDRQKETQPKIGFPSFFSSRETKQKRMGRVQQKQPPPRFVMDTTHKKMHQTNWLLPRKLKHAFLIVVADKQERIALAVHYCILASQDPQVLVVAVYRTVGSGAGRVNCLAARLLCLAFVVWLPPLSWLHVAPRHQSLRRSAACVPFLGALCFSPCLSPSACPGRSSPVASAFCSRERLRRFFVKKQI